MAEPLVGTVHDTQDTDCKQPDSGVLPMHVPAQSCVPIGQPVVVLVVEVVLDVVLPVLDVVSVSEVDPVSVSEVVLPEVSPADPVEPALPPPEPAVPTLAVVPPLAPTPPPPPPGLTVPLAHPAARAIVTEIADTQKALSPVTGHSKARGRRSIAHFTPRCTAQSNRTVRSPEGRFVHHHLK